MNRVIARLSALFSILLISQVFTSYCLAMSIDQHKFDFCSWGPEKFGMKLGFGIDKKELEDSTANEVTIKVIIKNTTAATRIFIRSGDYQGVRFFSRSADGLKTYLVYDPNGETLSRFTEPIGPNSEHGVFLRIKRDQLQSLIAQSDFAEVIIWKAMDDATLPSRNFPLEVKLVLPP